MSLLIKALDKAQTAKTEQVQAESQKAEQEKAKQTEIKKKHFEKSKAQSVAEADLELTLSPTGSALVDPASVAETAPQKIDISITNNTKTVTPPIFSTRPAPTNANATMVSAKSAANVFSAKGMDSRSQNKTLAIIAGASLLVLLGMGFYYYQYIGNQPDMVIPPAPQAQQTVVQPKVAQPTVAVQAVTQLTEEQNPEALPQNQQVELVKSTSSAAQEPRSVASVFEPQEQIQQVKKPAKKMVDSLALADNEAIEEPSNQTPSNQAEVIEDTLPVNPSKNAGKSKKLQFGESIASESASINVSKSNPQAGVNPILMSAYEAYNAGKDAEAQKLYKQVLQRDVRNTDALLGLGAIASRQGRVHDANGWYGKVLEIEPRNSLAQAALLDSQLQTNQSQSNSQDMESRLKNMLAKQPNDANLHVALGNLYAEQNQWASAQQAYFDAYSLNASADNSFNLAVSLDQMGKPKLALPYYQRALAQASSTSNIDRAALEARIAAIQ